MDSGDEPQLLLREGDTAVGWSVVTRLIAAMEHNQVRSLMRPDSKSARPTAERIVGYC